MTFSVLEKAETIADFRAKIGALRNCHFPVWEMEKLSEFVAFAVSKLSPLQVGDRARLTETPEITADKSWGWMSSKHMLVAGKCGVIRSVDWSDGAFIYSWEPDAQTWIFDGEEKPVDRPCIFIFGQRWLESVT